MMLCHAPLSASVTPALPKFRVHTTMKYEYEHRSDVKTQSEKGTHKRYIPSQILVVSSLKEDSSKYINSEIPRTVKAMSVLVDELN